MLLIASAPSGLWEQQRMGCRLVRLFRFDVRVHWLPAFAKFPFLFLVPFPSCVLGCITYKGAFRALRFLSYFSDNIMADVASKQQTTALFLSTTLTRTRRHTELTKKSGKADGETCAVLENIQFSFTSSSFAQLNCTV